MLVINSAECLVSMLTEPHKPLQVYALKKLDSLAHTHWPLISEYIVVIEDLFDDETFPERKLVALLASKILYHLGEYEDSLMYALESGNLFLTDDNKNYVDITLANSISKYIKLKRNSADALAPSNYLESVMAYLSFGLDSTDISPHNKDNHTSVFDESASQKLCETKLVEISELVIDAALDNNSHNAAIGIAFDTHDIVKTKSIFESAKKHSTNFLINLILHTLHLCRKGYITNDSFKLKIIAVLIEFIFSLPADQQKLYYSSLLECYYISFNPVAVATLLTNLLNQSTLDAFQLAFDVLSFQDSNFQSSVMSHIERILDVAFSTPKRLDEPATPTETTVNAADSNVEKELSQELVRLQYILSGRAATDFNILFMHSNNHTDLQFLEYIKTEVESRNGILRTGIIVAHALMQSGTTCDTFIRKNTEWLSKAMCWTKFIVVSSYGVIHYGQYDDATTLLQAYLPSLSAANSSPYIQGGSLLAMGLIHTNTANAKAKKLLLSELKNKKNDIFQHGACLGLGLVCIGQHLDNAVYEEMKSILFEDNAVASEAAAYGIGMLFFGTGSKSVCEELLLYAGDTQHDRVIRACIIAIGFVLYKQENNANSTVSKLIKSKDEIIRYGAAFVIAFAFCATCNNEAVCTLLNLSVSDSCDTVRRAAAIALGFVMSNDLNRLIPMISLMCESYNPHIRYGAAFALGIAAAGTGNQDAISCLWTLLNDSTDFVRQGVFIGLGLILQLHNEQQIALVSTFRNIIRDTCMNKDSGILTRFGSLVALGLLEAGGRNCKSTLFSTRNTVRHESVIGFGLFCQIWYWFPFAPMVALTFQPVSFIGVSENIVVPKDFKIFSLHGKKHEYAANIVCAKSEMKRGAVKAVLSTTAKRFAIDRRKRYSTGNVLRSSVNKKKNSVEVTGKTDSNRSVSPLRLSSPVKSENEKNEDLTLSSALLNDEYSSYSDVLRKNNPCRVLGSQKEYIRIAKEQRYQPLYPNRTDGFVMLIDSKPGEQENVLSLKREKKQEKEATPFTPFKWEGSQNSSSSKEKKSEENSTTT